MTLWHYTCDHGRAAIGDTGTAVPIVMHSPDAAARLADQWRWLAELVWFTDLYPPDPVALGLTRDLIECDRTAWRYRVTDPTGVHRWLDIRHDWPENARLLNIEPARPGRWWVSALPVPVELVTR